jgi:Ca-activated chloride channel homolog
MQFEYPHYLLLLLLIPLYLAVNQWIKKQNEKKMLLLGNINAIKKMLNNYDEKNIFQKQILTSVGLFFLTIAIANPQWGEKSEQVNIRQTDVVIALDISESMLCEDIQPSRLERAKQLAKQLIENLKAERVGIIVFAGEAYMQMPLTSDYKAAYFFLQSANTNLAATQGTNLTNAINVVQTLREGSKKPCSLLVFTDGETHDDDAIAAVKEAQNQGITSYIVGVGTAEGGFIPIRSGAYELAKKDEEGNLVKTKLNPDALKALAAAGNGDYLEAQTATNNDLRNWSEKIILMGADGEKKIAYHEKESRFQWFLLSGLLCFLGVHFFSYLYSRFTFFQQGIFDKKTS